MMNEVEWGKTAFINMKSWKQSKEKADIPSEQGKKWMQSSQKRVWNDRGGPLAIV